MRVKVLQIEDCFETDYIMLPTGAIGHVKDDPSIIIEESDEEEVPGK
jgi:hypothetical protein